MRQPVTLRGRLALLAVLTTACWVVLLTVGFNYLLTVRLRDEADNLLRTRAAAAAATVQIRGDGTLGVQESRDDAALDADIWIFQGRQALERPTAAAKFQAAADLMAGGHRRFRQTSEPFAIRFYALPVLNGKQQVGTIVAAATLDPYQRMASLALLASVGIPLLLLAGVYVVTRIVIGRALRPVTRMSALAADWSEHQITKRFGTSGRPAELADLAANLDALLDRLAAVLHHEQQLSAELSHELRTPLARITAETELLLNRPRSIAEQQAAHTVIADSAGQMGEILETLLSTARAGIAEPPGRCDLAEVVPAMANRGSSHGRPIRVVQGPGQRMAGVPAEIVERILTPILENAGRYAATGVTVTVEPVDRSVQIIVADDGPGIPSGLEEAVFEPGRRGDPRDGHDGAGLGLALARRLARAVGGEVTVAPVSRGARFVVALPPG
jgi:signal transduction histidine kinase